MHDGDSNSRMARNTGKKPENLVPTEFRDEVTGKITIGKVGRTTSQSLLESLIVELPIGMTMEREVVIPEAGMVSMGHGSERRYINRKTNTVMANAMKKFTDLCFGRALGKTRKSVQVGLDSALIGTKTRHPDGSQIVFLAGKLSTETDGMIADCASFGTWITPWTQGINAM